MARIEDLASRYQGHVSVPWQMNLAGESSHMEVEGS